MSADQISYLTGIPEQFREATAELYDQAFGQKLKVAISNREDRTRLFVKGMALPYAICAVSGHELLGIAGFHSVEGSLTGNIGYRDLLSQLGFLKGNWAAAVFILYERKPEPRELVMDGIAVRSGARGMGVGSTLLKELLDYAKQHEYDRVRLDVIDTNTRARKLYARLGFEAVKTESFPYLKSLLGYSGVTTMVFRIQGRM